MGRTEGILEASEMIPGEVLQEEDHVKVYVLEVQRAVAPEIGRASCRERV